MTTRPRLFLVVLCSITLTFVYVWRADASAKYRILGSQEVQALELRGAVEEPALASCSCCFHPHPDPSYNCGSTMRGGSGQVTSCGEYVEGGVGCSGQPNCDECENDVQDGDCKGSLLPSKKCADSNGLPTSMDLSCGRSKASSCEAVYIPAQYPAYGYYICQCPPGEGDWIPGSSCGTVAGCRPGSSEC